jgi:chaperonin cofactor prefoldin
MDLLMKPEEILNRDKEEKGSLSVETVLERLERRFEPLERRFESLERRFESLERRLDSFETRLVAVERKRSADEDDINPGQRKYARTSE